MNRDALKIFIACAIGAAVGTIVALDMNKYFWWLGLLAGGATGYLSYEWRTVMHAFPAAYRAAGKLGLPRWGFIRSVVRILSWGIVTTASSFVWMIIAAKLATKLIVGNPGAILITNKAGVLVGLCVILMIVSLGVTLISALAVALFLFAEGDNKRNSSADEFRGFAFIVSPPTVVFWHLPRGVCFVAMNTPNAIAIAARFVWSVAIRIPRGLVATMGFGRRFGWQLFVRIHSERRLICGVDALLGSMIGYFAGSAIIGALAGGVLGVINYNVVTERWLRPRGYIRAR